MACADENIKRDYFHRNIYTRQTFLSDSKAAIKALDKGRISSKLVWDCHQSLMILVERNKVYLMWVPGHKGIEDNESADHLARRDSLCPFIGPEPTCGVSERVVVRAIRDWVYWEHHKFCQSTSGQKSAKGFPDGLSARRTAEFLKLSWLQKRQVTGLLQGQCHLRGHPFKLGKVDNPICRRCLRETETASHILCACKALDDLRFPCLGRHFLDPDDYHEIPLSSILCFAVGTGLLAD
jgi:hypothetical protein